jgi:site-specific recombinase XerD
LPAPRTRHRDLNPNEPLFPTRVGRRLTRDAVQRRVTTTAIAAMASCPSLRDQRVHPHMLRHSCAMSLLQAGVDSDDVLAYLNTLG